MKQIIFTVIFIFAFCFVVFAQDNRKVNSKSQSSPKLLAQLNDTDGEWYKFTAQYIGQELWNNPTVIGLIRIKNDKNFSSRLRMLKLGFTLLKVSLNQVIFLIVDKQEHDTDVLVASNCSEIPKCEDCIVIRAIDIDKLGRLFRPKTNIQKTKKK